MIVIDTDVISAVIHQRPDAAVLAWLDRQVATSIWTTAVTVFEVQQGISLMSLGARRRSLELQFEEMISIAMANRVLPLDHRAAEIAGDLSAHRKRRGLNFSVADMLIAGIAIANLAQLATRNERHFFDLDVKIINPWREFSG